MISLLSPGYVQNVPVVPVLVVGFLTTFEGDSFYSFSGKGHNQNEDYKAYSHGEDQDLTFIQMWIKCKKFQLVVDSPCQSDRDQEKFSPFLPSHLGIPGLSPPAIGLIVQLSKLQRQKGARRGVSTISRCCLEALTREISK